SASLRCLLFQAEDGIRGRNVTGVQTCALPIWADPATAVVRTRLDAAANSSLTPLDLGEREQCCCICPGHGSRQTLVPSLQNTGPLCTHSCPPRPPDAPSRALRMPVCDPYHVRPAEATPTSPADRRKLRCSAQAGGYTVQLEFSIHQRSRREE